MLIKLDGFVNALKSNLRKSADFAGDVLLANVQHYANLTDHTTRDLAKMGHPYTKHNIHNKPYVHTQSGALLNAVEKKITQKSDCIAIECFIETAKAPHVAYIVNGTSKMVPRPFFSAAFKNCKRAIRAIIINGLHAKVSSRGGKV